jgi:6-pyruvoyltetrahydropterin/6-carboxytetrahydropterin synthase
MTKLFETTKQIELDAAHRVTYHDSKCKNIHGHRYKVEATVRGTLFTEGSSEGMVLDFGIIKQTMMQFIHDNCDHAAIFWWRDPILAILLGDLENRDIRKEGDIIKTVTTFGGARYNDSPIGNLYLVNFVPTAENLAQHWFDLIKDRIRMRSNEQATLVRLRVWETPTSYCDYPAESNVVNITQTFNDNASRFRADKNLLDMASRVVQRMTQPVKCNICTDPMCPNPNGKH